MMNDFNQYKYNFKNFIIANKDCIAGFDKLSNKQKEILIFKLSGFTDNLISKELCNSIKTTKYHCVNIHNILNNFLFNTNNKQNNNNRMIIYTNLFYQNLLKKNN